jgi:hypothetical protein
MSKGIKKGSGTPSNIPTHDIYLYLLHLRSNHNDYISGEKWTVRSFKSKSFDHSIIIKAINQADYRDNKFLQFKSEIIFTAFILSNEFR